MANTQNTTKVAMDDMTSNIVQVKRLILRLKPYSMFMPFRGAHLIAYGPSPSLVAQLRSTRMLYLKPQPEDTSIKKTLCVRFHWPLASHGYVVGALASRLDTKMIGLKYPTAECRCTGALLKKAYDASDMHG